MRRTLLLCGVFSSLLYAVMTVEVARQWPAYRWTSQTISELSAIDAPTPGLWVPLGVVYTLLVAAFGAGLRQAAGRNWALKASGTIVVAHGVIGLAWPPMHSRTVLAAGGGTLTDTLHLVFAALAVFAMVSAMAFGAAAFGRRFRRYTVASILLLGVCGAATVAEAPRIHADLPTPWVGVWERANVGLFLLWTIVLAIRTLRSLDEPVADRVAPQ